MNINDRHFLTLDTITIAIVKFNDRLFLHVFNDVSVSDRYMNSIEWYPSVAIFIAFSDCSL